MAERHNLPALFLSVIRQQPRAQFFGYRLGEKRWTWLSTQDALQEVREIAGGLLAMGLQPGDRVGLLSENRPHWMLADMGVQFAVGADVPIYPTLPPDQTAFILKDSGARFLFVSTPAQAAKIAKVRAQLTSLELVICFDGPAQEAIPLEELRQAGRKYLDQSPGALEERLASLGPETLATLIYTSGTTGTPKGVMLTHGNLCSNVAACRDLWGFERGSFALSFLPLSHVFERMVSYVYLEMGLGIGFIKGPEQLREALLELRPQVFVTVPKVLEMITGRIKEMIEAKGALARGLGLKALTWAEAVVPDLVAGRPITGLKALRYKIADKLVLSKLRERMGGRLQVMISGGAGLPEDVARFFWSAGIPVDEGYGMTETSPVIAVNHKGATKLGTVGRPVARTKVHIAADGEVLVQGPGVMKGYWNKPAETEQALAGGWLHTGDLGRIDDEGFLRLTGRKKEILVLSTGKNVATRSIEESLERSPFINRVIAVGDERPAVGVLIVPNMDRVLAWAAEHKLPTNDSQTLLATGEIRQLFEAEILRLQSRLAAYEKARRFEFLLDPMSEENGLLTPTQKVRRHEVLRRFSQLVEKMYG